MKNLALLSILLLNLSVHVNAQTSLPPITLTWTLADSLSSFEPSFADTVMVQLRFLPKGFEASFSPDSEPSVSKWTLRLGAPVDSFIVVKPTGVELKECLRNFYFNLQANPQVIHDTLVGSQAICDTLVVIEKRNFSDLLKCTFIPGGARFHKDSKILGLFLGVLEVAPIPLWFYFNHEGIVYYDRAADWARNVSQDPDLIREQINYNYDRSQEFRRYRDVAATVFAGAFLLNLIDTVLNVKECVCLNLQDLSRMGLRIRWETRNGQTTCRIEKAF